MKAPLPDNEARRIARLGSYRILDSMPENAYDDLLAITTSICGVPMGAISLVDRKRQWFKARKGLDPEQTPREQSFCAHAILEPQRPLVVPDALQDPRFSDNPLVTGEPGIRFYAGAPLVSPEGLALGSLCVMDVEPHHMQPAQENALMALSRQVMALLELRRAHRRLERALAERDHYEAELLGYQRHLESENAELMAQSRIDPLTGLSNRRVLDAALEAGVAVAESQGMTMALAMIDIDHFKRINDTWGHAAGDRTLAAVAHLIHAELGPHGTASRYGGEEFAVVMPDTPLDRAMLLCEAIRKAMESLQLEAPATVSIGVTATRDHDTAGTIFTRADQALYDAKRGGRNRVVAH